jgi:hypothetical protein
MMIDAAADIGQGARSRPPRIAARVELTENHETFRAMGFTVETGRTAHPGYDRPTSITFRRALLTPRPPLTLSPAPPLA